MDIIDNKEKMIFKNTNNDKVSYLIGLSKKKEDGTYENGYINCRFKKDVELENKTKVLIKSAWLDFFKADKKTIPYIFINDFEIVQQQKEETTNDKWEAGKNVEFDDDELPFY